MLTLVTGGNGFLGRYIVEQLLARGDRVRVLGRNPYPELEALGVVCVRADLSSPDVALPLAKALQGVEVVFHVAAKASVWGTFDQFYVNNVTATQRLVRAAERAGVPRFVYTSSPSVVIGETDLEGADESTPYPERYLAPYPATKA
ncbi:MAG: NAD-dependent epimerase/dehydratase family protein, partial [Chloroflexia bacterium]|nr:NAD-dependent epimerase/dehydratase family protein [Chloroflexia bacterium]